MCSRRLNPFDKQNTQDLVDDSDIPNVQFSTYGYGSPPTLVLDEDGEPRPYHRPGSVDIGVNTDPEPGQNTGSNSLSVANLIAGGYQGGGSRRGSCAAIVTHCYDEETDECYKNLKPRPSLGGGGGSRNQHRGSIVLELPQPRRSPRGSICGDGDRSRCGSACSQSSSASAISWTTIQALRRSAAAALGNSSRAGSFAAATEYSMYFGTDPDFFPSFESNTSTAASSNIPPTVNESGVEQLPPPTNAILDPIAAAGRKTLKI